MNTDSLSAALVEYLRDAPPDKALTDWHKLPWVHAAYRTLADEYIASLTAPPVDLGEGTGIVTSGGGTKYFPSLYVLLYRLRQLRCRLPIEVWHLGEAEIDPVMRQLIAPFDVTLRDAAVEAEKSPVRVLQGWQMKPFCILHSAFRNVLFLDADNAPVSGPEHLFDHPAFKNTGAVFWPDFFSWIVHPIGDAGEHMVKEVYSAFGLPLPKLTTPPGADHEWFGKTVPKFGDYDLTFEAGQVSVNKERCWRELSLALWYAQHSEFYFSVVHGDKECFHFAWRKLGTRYALVPTMPGYDQHTAIQFDFNGRPLFEHRNKPNAKWNLGRNVWSESGTLQVEPIGMWLMEQLAKQWSGVVWLNTTPSKEEMELGKSIAGRVWMYERSEIDARRLQLLADGTINAGTDKHERFWSVFLDNGKPRLSILGEDGPTCFLSQDGERWVGRWLKHEKCEVELRPVKGRQSGQPPVEKEPNA